MTPKDNLALRDETQERLLDLAAMALDRAREMGASMAEVSVSHGQGLSVTVRKEEVETIEHHRDKGMNIRVFLDGCSGTASCSDFSSGEIRNSVQTACNIARHTERDDCNGLADRELLATEFPDLDLHHPWNVTLEEAVDIARRCESAALEFDNRITNSEGGGLSTHDGVEIYANSHGFCGISRGSQHGIHCSVISGIGQAMQRDYWYDSRRVPEALADPESVGRTAARRTVNRIGARKLATGEYPVVFEAPVAQSLVGHLVSAIQGAGLYKKASFLHDRLGCRIFPQGIHIHEQPLLPRAAGSAGYDGEGVATRNKAIVDDGVLSSFLLDSYTARKLGKTSTGNAGGIHNLTVDSTARGGLEGMLKTMDRGILVTELIGFGVNTVTGDYSRGAFGYWVEQGEIRHPVQEFTIAGNLNDMFMGICAVGDDVMDNRNIRTGSIMLERLAAAGE
ncbi:MAG: metalloprotease PmbA [Gammaproteobacteria bacterium]|nr:metalloprotease PmbA [Gammaproteobacteria bacterium]MYD75118.1 metalloprotease PmbA [Gammaproteobacteria bacterium]MYJ53304.1 metalloprotease PmbA [Gammaproteobacteria bacterium]